MQTDKLNQLKFADEQHSNTSIKITVFVSWCLFYMPHTLSYTLKHTKRWHVTKADVHSFYPGSV